MKPLRALSAAILALAPAACGSVAVETSGTGGGGATTSSSSTSSGVITGDPFCGGEAGVTCAPDQFCHFSPDALCGGGDQGGVCQPKPGGCTADCPGVCGCDAKFYCNACSAQQAGVDIAPDGFCTAAGDAYRAVNLFTNVPRFAILKTSPSHSWCFRLIAEPGTTGVIQGDGWSITGMEVTDDPMDCDFPPGWPPPPLGMSAASTAAQGHVTFGPAPDCTVAINAIVNFPNNLGWPPADEWFVTGPLPIEGGCP